MFSTLRQPSSLVLDWYTVHPGLAQVTLHAEGIDERPTVQAKTLDGLPEALRVVEDILTAYMASETDLSVVLKSANAAADAVEAELTTKD